MWLAGAAPRSPSPWRRYLRRLLSSAAFEGIRQAWRSPEKTPTDELQGLLEGFLARFPDDGRVPFARILLALVAMKKNDLPSADSQLARCANLPPGSVRDLFTVARARRLRLGGDAESALDSLRPLLGKNVDPIARTVFEEELTLAALATHREYEAISYMDAWLRASPEDEKERTVAEVQSLVERLPQDVLLGALQAMRSQRASYGYGVDIERILATRLVGIATTSGNAQLARTLLDPGAGALVVGGDAGVELGALATSRRGLNSVGGPDHRASAADGLARPSRRSRGGLARGDVGSRSSAGCSYGGTFGGRWKPRRGRSVTERALGLRVRARRVGAIDGGAFARRRDSAGHPRRRR